MTEEFEEGNRKKIALLVDGDNAQPSLIEKMLAETGKYGQITIKSNQNEKGHTILYVKLKE